MTTLYTTIKDITPTTESWKNKMRVLEKFEKRTNKSLPLKYQILNVIRQKSIQSVNL
jgi:hypothetical protein